MFVATDERELLVTALESLWATSAGIELEVVVVDNASRDGTSEEVARRWPAVRVLRQPTRRGLATNLNAGIGATTAPYVLACNSDIELHADACQQLAMFMDRHPRAAVVTPRLVSPAGQVWPAARRWYTWRSLVLRRVPLAAAARTQAVRRHLYAEWDGHSARPVDWVLCAAAMLRREALEEIGLMDERFRIYFDDVDLARRAHDADWEVWIAPEAEVLHHWRRASRRPLSGAWFSHLSSLLRFLVKHRGLRPKVKPGGEVSVIDEPDRGPIGARHRGPPEGPVRS